MRHNPRSSSSIPPEPDGAAFDLVVIGLGPAGEKGAAQAAYFGKRVAAVEEAAAGGAVVNTGTLPSKTLRETALYLSGMRSRGLYGIEYSFARELSVEDLFHRQQAIERSHLDLVHENLDRHGITVLSGAASIEDAHTVCVRGGDGAAARLAADYILIATGSRPVRPPAVPFDGEYVYDTDSILRLRRIPRSLAIIGAGVIGSEYATLFAAIGARVTLVDAGADLLPFLDRELAGVLCDSMRTMGIELAFGRRIEGIALPGGDAPVAVTLDDGRIIRCDAALYCGGRAANIEGLGLDRLGIQTDARNRIAVDDCFRTSVPSIFAAGDVVGFPALASTSMEQARVAVCHAFGFEYKRSVSDLVPYALYTIPEIAMAGGTEASLKAAGTPYLVGRAHYRQNARAQILGDTAGLLRLLFAPDDLRLLGAQIIGERASEVIHVAQMCMQFEGTINAFIDSVFNFPTITDAYKYAAYDGLQVRARWLEETTP